MDGITFRHRCEYLAFSVIVFGIRCLPSQTAHRAARGLAAFIHHRLPRRWTRYAVSEANVRQALGEEASPEDIDAMVLGMWEHLFRMICELVEMPRRLRVDNFSQRIRFVGRPQAVRALCAGRPLIFLSGHFGNWEAALTMFGCFGFPMDVVARKLDNPLLHNWFLKFREDGGHRMVLKQGAGNQLVETLEAGGAVAMLADQDAGRSGVFVDFFGKPAATYKTIALLAMQYDALISVGGTWRLPAHEQTRFRPTRFELAVSNVIDPRDYTDADAVRQMTQDFTNELENLIRKAPEQYFWVHRRWKTPPDVRKRRRRARAAA